MDMMSILLVFFLVLLIKWNWVKRPKMFWVGVVAIAVGIISQTLMALSRGDLVDLWGTVGMLATLVALAGAIGAAYGQELPVKIPKWLQEENSEKAESESEQ